jgi:mono/diheme cytochrome c family protein
MSIPRDSFKDFGVDRGSTMPSYKGKLTETELDDIVSYLASLQRKKGSPE